MEHIRQTRKSISARNVAQALFPVLDFAANAVISCDAGLAVLI